MISKVKELLLKSKKTLTAGILENIAFENNFLDEIALALCNGADVVDFDGTKLSGKDYLTVAKKLRDLCGEFDALLIIKDRIDIGMLANADGISLDGESILPSDAHNLTENNLLLGYHAWGGMLPNESELQLLDFLISDTPINTDIKVFQWE